jgi:C-8 sterol isomerase
MAIVPTREATTMPHYRFDPDVMHTIAVQYLGLPCASMFAAITDALAARYPGAVSRDQPWIFSNAGGVMIQIKLLHASAGEYLMLWGTPIGSEGHSGRHRAAFYSTVLDGEAWYYRVGQVERDVYGPGDRIFVDRGQSAGIRILDHVWVIEYARGALLLSLPFGLAHALLSTLDYATIRRSLAIYLRLAWRARRNAGTAATALRVATGRPREDP